MPELNKNARGISQLDALESEKFSPLLLMGKKGSSCIPGYRRETLIVEWFFMLGWSELLWWAGRARQEGLVAKALRLSLN